jgi:hypothetical protein
MNHDWNPSPDPLVTRHLPTGRESPDWCELSERINELPPSWATYETIRYFLLLSLSAAVIGVFPRYAFGTEWVDMPYFWLIVFAVKLVFCLVFYLSGSFRLRTWLTMTGMWVVFGGLLWMQSDAAGHSQGYFVLFPIAVGCSAWLAYLVSTQFAFYSAADLNNEWFVADEWRCNWIAFAKGTPPSGRPEFHSMPRLLVALGFAMGFGVIVNEWVGFGEAAFLVGLFLITPFFWTKGTDIVACLSSSWRAWEVFLTYERKPVSAPGVFRFPTRWLRPHLRRIVAVFTPLILVALSVATTLPAKWPIAPSYDFIERSMLPPNAGPRPPMTRIEEEHYNRIAFLGEQEAYLSLIRRRRAHEEAVFNRAQKNYTQEAVTTAVACVLIPPAVVFGTLVFLFGPVLAAYRRNLAENAES